MSFLRALVRLHGRAFAEHAAPLLLALMLGGAILLGPNGLDPRTVASEMTHRPFLRVAMAIVFGIFARPATQALILPPGSTWIRSAPIRLGVVRLVSAGFVLVVHAPFVALAASGRDVVLALTVGSLSVAIACARWRGLELITLAFTLLAAFARARPAVAVMVPLTCTALTFSSAFRRAPERTRRVIGVRLRWPPIVAVLLTHLIGLVRIEGSRLSRTLAGVFVIAFFGATVVGSDGRIDPVGAILAIVGVASALTLAMLGRAIGRARRRIAVWLRASGRSVRTAFVVASLVQALPPLVAAALFVGLRVRAGAELPWSRLVPIALFSALSVAMAGLRVEDLLLRRQRDGALLWVLVSVAFAGLMCGLAASPSVAVVVLTLLATVALVMRDQEVPVARA